MSRKWREEDLPVRWTSVTVSEESESQRLTLSWGTTSSQTPARLGHSPE